MTLRADVPRSADWFVGEDKVLQFTIWQDKAKTAREDITGWTFIYEFFRDGAIAFSVTTAGGGILVTDGPLGEGRIVVPSADTAALPDTRNLHHILRRADAGDEAVLFTGDVILNTTAEV